MSTWVEQVSSSHRLQLATTAVVSGLLVGGAIIGYQNTSRRHRVHELKDSIPDPKQKHDIFKINEFGAAAADGSRSTKEDERGAALAARARLGDYDEELILEQLARNRVFLTDEGLGKLRKAFIIVVGVGGVGSHAAAALARSGAGKIRLIDFDQVSLSSLNRHAVATLADVGTPKVHCLRKRLEQIVPWTHFDCRNELFSGATAESQLAPWTSDGQAPDFVVDAIDNIDSKVDLLAYCHKHNIKVISSMGAGCKSDPTRVFIGDISSSTDDPLSRSTRRRLRMRGIKEGIPVVYSQEKTGPGKAQLLPLPEEEYKKGDVGELSALPDFRVRILPVLGTMPAVFGLCVANHVMLSISGYPHEYLPSKSRDKLYDGILSGLQGNEERLVRAQGGDPLGLKIAVTHDDVGYMVEEVYRGRSVVSGLSTRLSLLRWKKPETGFVDNSIQGQRVSNLKLGDLVLMTKDEAQRHEKEVLKGDKTVEDLYDEKVRKLVEARMNEERLYRAQR
ncbi:hypothetical protein AAFC00_000338 [Neodothiora populina]|uniref:THIF-type NAD/FAD binding fold domain-containing protein n=1 Tax=Neodothiora populina TaxID=2781224 RepID=A0ABR3PCL5_9PEZI